MAETVYFLDGSMDVVLTEKDAYLERLIREKLGDDVARLFRECVTEMQDNLAFQQEATDEQERSADGYFQMCHDACDSFREIIDLLDEPRLNRSRLRTAAQTGYDNLYKNL